MERYHNPIGRLTLSLEVYAYALPVMLLAYFVVIAGDLFSVLKYVIPSVLLGSVVTFVAATYLRWRRLNGPFKSLADGSETDVRQLQAIKLALLTHPRYEAISIFFRYPVGVGIAAAMIAMAGEMTVTRLAIVITGTVMVIPVNAVLFMFQTEISLSRYLKEKRLAGIIVDSSYYSPVRLFPKILYVLISILLPPLAIFITFITLISLGQLRLDYMILHFMFVTSIMLATTITAAYFFATSQRSTISDMERSLDDIARGELGSDPVPMITIDEVGSMSVFVNRLRMKISEVLSMIQSMSVELSGSAGEMAGTAEHFATQSSETAATVEEITSVLEELSAGGESIFGNIEYQHRRTMTLIENLEKLYAIVNEEGRQMEQAMKVKIGLDKNIEEVKGRISDTMELMRTATNDAGRMLDYTGLINDISERTNLLSLNASIEAARAGDYGKGFAVVADEIGKLADQASENTKSISEIVRSTNDGMEKSFLALGEAIAKIQEIFDGLNAFGDVVNKIGDLTRKDVEINTVLKEDAEHFMERANNIIKAMDEQRVAIAEIVKSVSQINESTQSNSASSEELNAVSERVAENSNNLKSQIEFFKIS